MTYCLSLVVVALEQLAAALVADSFDLCRVILDVPDVAALAAGPAARESLDDFLVVNFELEDDVERGAQVTQNRVEFIGLGNVSREPVQQKACGRVRLTEPITHHRNCDLVGYQVAGVHVLLRELAQLGPARNIRTENVAGRDLRNRKSIGDEFSLRTLTRPWRAHENQPHIFACSSRETLIAPFAPLVAGSTRAGRIGCSLTSARTLHSCAA